MRGLINTIREMNLVKEDGHVDVSSSIRKCKTAMEDASQIMSKLQTMDPEGSLPTWWTNKLAIASMSFNKMRDYLLVSGEQKEEVDLSEKEMQCLIELRKIYSKSKHLIVFMLS